jgi:uncharacterized protein (DUF1778 family)
MSSASAKQAKKIERMELRVSSAAKKIILRATSVSGLAAGDLALEGARRILDDHERMTLRGADRDAFLKALASPPRPNKSLVAALRRHRNLAG